MGDDGTIEVAFNAESRSLFLDLPRAEIPRIGETVYFHGRSVKGSEWERRDFTVTGVARSYDKDSNTLAFVNVTLAPVL